MMADRSDDIVNGECCDLCGTYFEKGGDIYTHGYPATCWYCWAKLSDTERLQHREAEVPPYDTHNIILHVFDDEAADFSDYNSDIPFKRYWEDTYTIGDATYEVAIMGVSDDNTGKNNYYTAAYGDGSSRDITFEPGTGWIEKGIGQSPHAIALGNLIEIHFMQDPAAAAQEQAENFEVSDIEVVVNGEQKVFALVHNAAEYNIDIYEALQYWVRNNKRYDVEAFCNYLTKLVPGVICVPKLAS